MKISLKLGILEKANELIKSIACAVMPTARYQPLLQRLAHLA